MINNNRKKIKAPKEELLLLEKAKNSIETSNGNTPAANKKKKILFEQKIFIGCSLLLFFLSISPHYVCVYTLAPLWRLLVRRPGELS